MRAWFEAVVKALTETILHEQGEPATSVAGFESVAGSESQSEQVAAFILQQHGRMPDYLRPPLMFLTLAFDVAPFLGLGGFFHRQSLQRRQQQVLSWKRSRLGPCRDLMKLYESLAVFGWFSQSHASDSSPSPERPA